MDMTAFLITLAYWAILFLCSFLIQRLLEGSKYAKYTSPLLVLLAVLGLNMVISYFKPFGYVIGFYWPNIF